MPEFRSDGDLTILLYKLPEEVSTVIAEALSHVAPDWGVATVATGDTHSPHAVVHEANTPLPEAFSQGYIITLNEGESGEYLHGENPYRQNRPKIPDHRHYQLKKPFHLIQLQQTLSTIAVETGQCGRDSLTDFCLQPREKLLVRRGNSSDERIALTDQEMSVLSYLLAQGDVGTSRAVLLREVWGYAEGVETQTIETHISRLRQKLSNIGLQLAYENGEYCLRLKRQSE